MLKHITRWQAESLIRGSEGRTFCVHFRKRSDGSDRTMVASTNISQHVNGRGRNYNAKDHGLIVVTDLELGELRSVPIEGIVSVRFGKDEEILYVSDSPDNPL